MGGATSAPLEPIHGRPLEEVVDVSTRADVTAAGHLLTEAKLKRLLGWTPAQAEAVFRRLDVRHEMRVDLSTLLIGMGLASDAPPSEKLAFAYRVMDPKGAFEPLSPERSLGLLECGLRALEAFFGVEHEHADVAMLAAQIAGVRRPEDRQRVSLTFPLVYNYCSRVPGFVAMLEPVAKAPDPSLGRSMTTASVKSLDASQTTAELARTLSQESVFEAPVPTLPLAEVAKANALASPWLASLACPRSRAMNPVRGCPKELNPEQTEFTIIRKRSKEAWMDGSAKSPSSPKSGKSGKSPASVANERRKTVKGKEDYFETLTPEEVRDLHQLFTLVDSTNSGLVVMEDFTKRLHQGCKADATGFLKKAYAFFKRSVTADRQKGFKSFKGILELLLPAISAAEVDDMMAKVAKAKKPKATKSQKNMQKLANIGLLQKRMVQAFQEEDSEPDENEVLKEVTVHKAQEYRELFLALTRGKKELTEQQFYDSTADVMNHNERKEFFAKYVRRMRLKRNQEATKVGFQCALYKADFETFCTMILPRGYKLPEMPDPLRHVASDDELWQLFYSKQTADPRRERAARNSRKKFALPQLERHDKAGRPLPGKIYQQREVQETRKLKHHEAIILDPEEELPKALGESR